MIGAILGDIAGSIYEFDNIKTMDFPLFGPGTEYTDDSILSIAVAEWILRGDISGEVLIPILKSYVRRYPNPMGSYGCGFLTWAGRDVSKPYGSFGNGAAMRVSPIGWAFSTLDETELVASISASITHNHPEGIKGAKATAAAIYLARSGKDKDKIKDYVESAYRYNLSQHCEDIRPSYAFDSSCQGTVPQAIVAFLDSNSFEDALRLAVSLGGDSDTLTCITGGIAEAYYGVPAEMRIEALQRLPADLESIVNEFCDRYVR